jgi:hypothetical protein
MKESLTRFPGRAKAILAGAMLAAGFAGCKADSARPTPGGGGGSHTGGTGNTGPTGGPDASSGQGGSGGTGGTTATGGSAGTGGTSGSAGRGGAGRGGVPDAGSGGGVIDAGSGGSAGRLDGGPSDAGGKPFVHPGVIVNRGMLDFVKAKIASGAEPWTTALARATSNGLASKSYVPHPFVTVDCGSYSMPDNGCTEEKNDVNAAYTQALLFKHTGDVAYAQKAIEIMNAWSSTLKDHTNSNAPLQAAWAAESFPRAAEIIRYTGAGWADADVAQFARMLKEVYLPKLIDGSSSNGNWELSMIEAVINIGVFTDDRATFDKGVTMWRERVPAYVYIASDGPTPVPPPRGAKTGAALITFWYGQSMMMDGLSQETCRDLGHVQYGLAAMINAAETAMIQGVDLFAEQADRITAALEFHAKFINGAAVPAALCGGALTAATADPMWEIGYNAYATRLGRALPETQKVIQLIRPTSVDHHMVWETLTHADIGKAGL